MSIVLTGQGVTAQAENSGIEMVLVPRAPTKEMVAAAYWASLDDDIPAVWEKMIEAWLRGQQREAA
jgi:hypothetical protein